MRTDLSFTFRTFIDALIFATGLTQRELALVAGVNQTSISRAGRDPKISFAHSIAQSIGWDLNLLMDAIGLPYEAAESVRMFDGFDEAKRHIHKIYQRGKYEDMLNAIRSALQSPNICGANERAELRSMECNAQMALGFYAKGLKACRTGLEETPIVELQHKLSSNIAICHFDLGHLDEARRIAQSLVAEIGNRPDACTALKNWAFCHYVIGHCHREKIQSGYEDSHHHAEQSIVAFNEAEKCYLDIAKAEPDKSWYASNAQSCAFLRLEAEVFLSPAMAPHVASRLLKELDAVVDLDATTTPVGQQLITYAWVCILGARITRRHVSMTKETQQMLGVFSGKARDIAQETGNWAMAKRAFEIEYDRHEFVADMTGFTVPWKAERDDLLLILGTLARFVTFRKNGLAILREMVSDLAQSNSN